MRLIYRLLHLGRNLVYRREVERRLSIELAGNLDLLIEEKVRAGLSLAAARRAAQLEFGGVEQVKEQVRRVQAGYHIESLIRDFRYAARSLGRTPGFGILAVSALAITGAAASIAFSLTYATLIQPLNFPRPGKLLQISEHSPEHGLREADISLPKFRALTAEMKPSTVGAYTGETVMLRTPGELAQVSAARVSETLLDVLGVQPEQGQPLTRATSTILLTHRCWRDRFESDETLIGEQIAINGENYTVAGVLPENLPAPLADFEVIREGVETIDFFAPEQIQRGAGYLHVIARCDVKEMPLVHRTLQRVDAEYRRTFPGNMDAGFVSAASDLKSSLTQEVRPFLAALCGSVGCLFTIACLNVCCLFLARLNSRRQELALRAALGAERRVVIQHMFGEMAIVTAVGLALALFISTLAIPGLGLVLDSPVLVISSILPRVVVCACMLFGGALSLLTVAAAFYTRRWHRDGTLAVNSPAASLAPLNRLSSTFVVAQIAISLVLLLTAGLLWSTLQHIQDITLGFDPNGVLTSKMLLLPNRYRDSADHGSFADRLITSVEKLPNVERAAMVYGLPFAHDDTNTLCTTFAKRGRAVSEWQPTYYRVASPGYFEALRIPLIIGRPFTFDDNASNPSVVIVSAATSMKLFGDANPIGRKVVCGGTVQTVHEVIGVVGDVRSAGMALSERGEMYFSTLQQNEPVIRLVVRSVAGTAEAQLSVARAVTECLRSLDPEQPALKFETMQQLIGKSVASRRLLVFVLGALATVAVILTMIGTYGTMSFAVIERRREMAMRLALGASRKDILRLVLARGFRLILGGVFIGAAVAIIVAWRLSGLLFDGRPADPTVLVVSTFALVTLTLASLCLPARRAMRVDLMAALRV